MYDHFYTKAKADSTHSLLALDQPSSLACEASLFSEFQYWLFVPWGGDRFLWIGLKIEELSVYSSLCFSAKPPPPKHPISYLQCLQLHTTVGFLFCFLFWVILAYSLNKASAFVVKKIWFHSYRYLVLQATSVCLSRDFWEFRRWMSFCFKKVGQGSTA